MKCPNNYEISMFPGDKCLTCDYYDEDEFGTTCCTVNTKDVEENKNEKGVNKK